jgi:hypothetical protein
LETARLNGHQDKPSRLDCAFAFLTVEEAQRFRPQGFQTHVLYQVTLVDPTQPTFIADTARCSFHDTMDWGVGWAAKYWAGVNALEETLPPQVREVLTLSALRIVARVE